MHTNCDKVLTRLALKTKALQLAYSLCANDNDKVNLRIFK